MEEASAESPNLTSVRAACAVDAILAYRVEGQGRRAAAPFRGTEVARSGEPCAAATDKAACEDRLQNIAFPDAGFSDGGGSRSFLVVSRGGSLELVANRAELIGLIGPADSKHDAAALLWLGGWRGVCAKLQPQGGAFVVPREEAGVLCPPQMRGPVTGAELLPSPPQGYDEPGDYRLQIDRQGKLKVTFLGPGKSAGPGEGRVSCGRRPTGMALHGGCGGGTEVGAYLAECAELEAAAVVAFELLAAELTAHDAPPSLVERCHAAAEDERRHTLLMSAAARRYGAEPVMPAPLRRPLPSLRELAQENSVEGCVRETWGALSAALQARTAGDPDLAILYESIAPDELAHAQLSWDIHYWLATRLGDPSFLEDVMVAARAELLAAQADPAIAVAQLAGAPGRVAARRLILQLAA